MQWLAKRNTKWAKATQIPATAMELRHKVVDFMQINLQTNWALKGLSTSICFQDAIVDEFRFGVVCGLTGQTLHPQSVAEWFEASRMEFTFTSLCCVQATALCYDLVIKIFIQGSNAVEQYVPRDCLLQDQEHAANVNPDVCLCLCKRDRGGHFDPCQWVAPKVYAHNPPTKVGRGKARQNRFKSSTEIARKKTKPSTP
jgi:hypothetical protein